MAQNALRSQADWEGTSDRRSRLLDSLRENPDQFVSRKARRQDVTVTLKDIVYDAAKGDFPHRTLCGPASWPETPYSTNWRMIFGRILFVRCILPSINPPPTE